jgi:hypothetical protein
VRCHHSFILLSNITLTTWCGLAGLAAPSPATAFEQPLIAWAPRAYVCPRLDPAPTIDGRLDDAGWAPAPWSDPFTDIRGELAVPPRHQTRIRLGWDEGYFYVAARLDEPHVQATLTERDAVIYHDNDFEVFIDPDGDNHLYGELEINALGTVWDLLLVRPYRDGGPAIDAWDIAGLRSAVAVDGSLNDPGDRDEGWTVELAIPWKVLGPLTDRACPPASGDIWRMNFSRVQWRTEVVEGRYRKLVDAATGRPLPEDNWVWSPQGLIAMHCPEMWGQVLFADHAVGDDPADAARAVAAADEHTRMAIANGLMPLYYRQQALRETGGAYAGTLAELEVPAGHWPLWPGGTDRVGASTAPLPGGWTLDLNGGGTWFRATLTTPLGTATIDHTGKLERTP